MSDEGAASETITADDWGAAMSEQVAADASAGTDDWAAAMAEQEAAPAQPAASKAHVFEKFGASAGSSTHNDLDMILDIPVQLTVELGRTKMAIKNLLQLAQGSVV